MIKQTSIFFTISAIFIGVMFTTAQSHDVEIERDFDIKVEVDKEMSSEELKDMVLKIISDGLEVGAQALDNAMATIKIQAQQNSLPDLIEETSPAVVRIAIRGTMQSKPNPFFDDPFFERFFGQPQMPREREFGGGGSGVIVDGELGYIITNAHVIDRADEI